MATGKKYPAQLTFVTTSETYDAIAEEAQRRDESKAVVAREYLEHGRVLVEALASIPDLAERVESIRRSAGASRQDAIATMLDFAARESARRLRRDATIAEGIAGAMAASGIPFDGVGVGAVEISIE
jgi:hypothetical protein